MPPLPNSRSHSTSFRFDWGLLSVVISLWALGLVLVFSSSFTLGITGQNDPFYFFVRQLAWSAIGMVALVGAVLIPYRFWQRSSVVLMGSAVLALLTVLIFGATRFGATRTYFGGSVQPSEPVKIITILYISAWLTSKGKRIQDVRVGLLPFSVLIGIVTVLVVAQPQISAAILIVATAGIMFFIAGAELKQLLVVSLVASLTFWLVITNSSYAGGRFERYMASLSDPLQSTEYQVQRSVEALTRGGFIGVGIGNSEAKLPGYLPLSWSDNIFAIVGEELGLVGTLVVILLFGLLAYRGFQIALQTSDSFGRLVAIGITSSLILQALLNIAVVVAVAPPTGVTLPFVSYGGSSLVTALWAVGILLSISRDPGPSGKTLPPSAKSHPVETEFSWRNQSSRRFTADGQKPSKRRAQRKTGSRR